MTCQNTGQLSDSTAPGPSEWLLLLRDTPPHCFVRASRIVAGYLQGLISFGLVLTTQVMQQSRRQQRRLILQNAHVLLSLLWSGATRDRARCQDAHESLVLRNAFCQPRLGRLASTDLVELVLGASRGNELTGLVTGVTKAIPCSRQTSVTRSGDLSLAVERCNHLQEQLQRDH